MATIHCSKTGLVPAAAYVRMSGDNQEKSPDEQRAEITKLASRHGYQIVQWFIDKAITGNSGTDERPGLANLLTAARAGTFKTVLAWHTNRISREDAMDALAFYNQLRKARVGLHTCCEGAIDLEDFSKQLLLFVGQKASNDYLIELSQKVVRGKIANAKAGGWNGGPAHYGMDRGEFDGDGMLVRRLQSGDCISKGHRVRLLPSTDQQKIEAIRYAFHRMDVASLPLRSLAREMEAKGYPSPRGTGWTHTNVHRLLTTRAYVGTSRWGATAWGDYFQAEGEEIIPTAKSNGNGKANNWRRKPEDDVIAVCGAHEGIIPQDLFDRVQAKLKHWGGPRRASVHRDYPLTDLLFCTHCGQKMIGETGYGRNRAGNLVYSYQNYVCSLYAKFGTDGQHNTTCGHHAVDARRVLHWLVYKLQEVYLGPGRDTLVESIRRQLKAQPKANVAELGRLEKRAADLDREVARLVKAIRTLDAAELVEELAIVKGERQRAKAELAQAGKRTTTQDLDDEAEQIADQLWGIGGQLTSDDPAILREVLRRFVTRIDCRWKCNPGRRRARYELVDGKVKLRPQTLFSVSGVLDQGLGPKGR